MILRLCSALFLFLITIFIIISLKFAPEVSFTNQAPTAIIDESMVGVHAQRFDHEGRLAQVVSMDSWVHHKGQTVTQMVAPTLKVYPLDGSAWFISAKNGEGFATEMGGQLEKLHLSQNVVVERIGHINDKGWQLKTETLLFFPQQPTALTDAPVAVYGQGMEIHALGMRAYLNRHHIEFLKDVNCSYVVPHA